ncbi:MAG: hypothetical protein M3N42_10540, partial [Cyanobacteriota bacterium]|nr:hypothetical protein [Cyanobacteriota bacterium]
MTFNQLSQDNTPELIVSTAIEIEQLAETHARFPIVGIAASAGGLEAFIELLRHLPVDTGMAFVLIQHLDPNH